VFAKTSGAVYSSAAREFVPPVWGPSGGAMWWRDLPHQSASICPR